MSLCLDGKKRLYKRQLVLTPKLAVGDWFRMYGGAVAQITAAANGGSFGMPTIRDLNGRINYYYGWNAYRLVGWGTLLGERHDVS